MAEKQNTPEIRFEGFTDPWEQRKLGEVGEIYTGNTPATDNPIYYSNDGIPWITPSDIADFDTPKPAKYLSEEGLKVGRTVPAGSIMCTCIASIGKNTITSTICGFNQQINALVPNKEQYDSDFLFAESHLWSQTMKRDAAAGTMQIVNKSEFSELNILKPPLIEQQAIGSFFSRLDHLITLHQRKYDKLCTVKKSMLDKMFPKPGETEPEIRFEGFTDPWEQRKLGELLLFQNGFNGSSESFGSGIPLISVMDVLDDKFITHETVRGKARLNCEEASRYCVEYGDVLFQRSSENQEDAGTSNVYLDQHVSSAFGGFVIRGKKVGEYNPIFIKYLLGSPFIREQITHRAQGAQHINVSQDTLADVVLLMPSMREQEAVGLVFLHLDNLITLHQRKLELLRNIKKSLLDRMFV